MPKVPYPYEVNGKLVTGNGSLIQICSLSNCSLLPSLTVQAKHESGITTFIFMRISLFPKIIFYLADSVTLTKKAVNLSK